MIFWPNGFVEFQLALSRFMKFGLNIGLGRRFYIGYNCLELGQIAVGRVLATLRALVLEKVVGILLVCAEAQIGNFVPGIFRRIKW